MGQKEKIVETYRKNEITKDFDKERSMYKYQNFKHDFERKILLSAVNESRKGRIKILDVACGTGRFLKDVFSANKDVEYHGLDTSKSMLNRLKKKDVFKKNKNNIKLHLEDAANMKFKDDSFDLVYTYHLLWHLPKDIQEEIVKEMFRVVKPGGFVLFDIINSGFIYDKMKKLLSKPDTEGIYKMKVPEAKRMANSKDVKIYKLLDAQIKSSALYSIVNVVNHMQFLPTNMYHMLFLKVRK